MRKVDVNNDTYRLIPSHFPPISLFENLLDPKELEAAYLLESMTNDRLQDQAGNIALVAPEDRVAGPGTTVIMAAFTHIGANSRFTKGRYGVYYAGLDLDTAIIESAFSRSRLMRATQEGPQVLTMRCYKCSVNAKLVDVRRDTAAHNPDSFDYSQSIGEQLRQRNEAGILYKSVRNPGGECIAAFRPTTLVPPAIQAGHFQFHWNGSTITDIMKIEKYK